ncbi:MAG: ribonuclease HII [Candidatus Hydrothermarchaeaceae archaeon]
MFCGIDEAGRGPVLGPLVIAGLACDTGGLHALNGLCKRDSKRTPRNTREKLYEILTKEYPYHVIKIAPQDLDRARNNGLSLNVLEAMKFGALLDVLKPRKAFLDCADVLPQNFRRAVLKNLDHKCELVVEHKADERYPIVSAASIIAKVERDGEIKRLGEKYGDMGSGYSSDPKTISFLEKWVRDKGELPPFARQTWKTSSRAKNMKLLDFF